MPSGDVWIVKPPVDALPPSPHVAVGSTANVDTSTACGSSMTMCLGTKTLVASPLLLPVVEPQPVAWLPSIAPFGPQPMSLRSGPLKSVMAAPPDLAAQSRRIEKSLVVPPAATVTDDRTGSKPGARTDSFG